MPASTPDVVLASARYGKDKVRVFRVKRENDGVHYVVEYNVTLLVEGDIDASYTKADNSVVVATDSLKNITYYLAKVSDHVLVPEHFALHLGTHVLSKYSHLRKAIVTVEQLRWSRITVSGQDKPHTHAFHRDGDDKVVVQVVLEKRDGKTLDAKVTSGIADLLVLKSTGSAFEGFIRDEYTTLVEVSDRILSTSVELEYRFAPVSIPVPTDPKLLDFGPPKNVVCEGTVWDATGVAERARRSTLDLFATDESASVQATLFKMGERVIAENGGVDEATYRLPNKHYIPVDMAYLGVDNLRPSGEIGGQMHAMAAVRIDDADGGMIELITSDMDMMSRRALSRLGHIAVEPRNGTATADAVTPATAEVFVPVAAPSGLISATISRKQT